MKKTKWIKASNLPPRIGIGVFLLWWLFLDRIAAPGWAYGVVFTVLAIGYAANLWQLWHGEAVDLFEEKVK